MIDTYEMACVEVLQILNQLPKDEYEKISKREIEFLEKNQDINYHFIYQTDIPIQEQAISKKANAILINIFQKYFCNDEQKKKLKEILIKNDKIEGQQKKEKYSINVFEKSQQQHKDEYIKKAENYTQVSNQLLIKSTRENQLSTVVKKESKLARILKNIIRRLFSKKE